MVAEPAPGGDGRVIPLRPDPAPGPEPGGDAHEPGGEAGARRPIIPPPLRRGNLGGTVRQAAGLHWHRARYHGLRSPWYTALTLGYAARGAGRLTRRLLAWWHWVDGWALESQAVAAGRAGHGEAMRAHTEGKKTRGARGRIVAACAAAAGFAVLVLAQTLPWQVWPVIAAALVAVLARHGKPAGKPIVQPAIVGPRYEVPTPEVITRALGSLGIPAISQAIKDGGLSFVSDVARDGPGWGVQLDLPHGVTATQILARREQLASGLRRPLSATWPPPVPHEHAGRLELWIGFHDISKIKPPVWPLLRGGQADVFASLPFGTDPRGRRADVPVVEMNWLIGAAPGQGKTSAVRGLACGVALDPLAELWIHELAGKGDLEPLARVCHRYVSGLDDEAIGYAAASLRALRAELDARSSRLRKLPKEQRPDGKVTRDLAARRGLRPHPIVAVFDEVQNLFMHPAIGGQAADDAGYVIRLGRAYGIVLVPATQRPDKDSLPTQESGNVSARFCLMVPGQVENDLILGTSSYRNGYNATVFRPKVDAGLGWLKAEDAPQVVRTYYLDLPATERVAARARALRGAAGVLSGYALGHEGDEPARSFAADVLSVFGPDAKLWSETIATRLRERIPSTYADVTSEAVASQLRALGVPVKDVRETGRPPRKGCEREAVEAAAGASDA